MGVSKLSKWWMPVTILVVTIIIAGGIAAWLRYSPGQPVEIYLPSGQEWQGRIYIDGAVNNPGSYPFTATDTVKALLQAAGGTSAVANLSELRLHIPGPEEEQPQKVDINRADVWLLQSLPGIGKTLAQRIVDYRQQNGPFRSIREIVKVAGIGTATYEQIKDLITVSER